MRVMRGRSPEVLLFTGFAGIATTLFLAWNWAPSVSINAFESPAAQRIFYWHVPSAWAALIAFTVLFVGSTMWFFKRNSLGWKLHVAGSEAGLACGLMVVCSGCIWGSAEWGTPWDWSDVRLNSFGLLTLLAMFLVLGRKSQPDGVETRDTFSTFGMYGFVLVPLTYISTRIWQIRHPGPVGGPGAEGTIDGSMRFVVLFGALAFTLLIAGHMMMSMRITDMEQRLEQAQKKLDEG